MSDNWVVQNLQNALDTWNKYLSEIWQLITQSPEQFKGGSIWSVIVNIHDAVRAIGLALEHTSFQYEGQIQENLRDVNLTIKSGEFLVITGQSGCGKTTLTRCINNLIPRFFEGVLSGEVIVSGRSIKESDAGEAGKEI